MRYTRVALLLILILCMGRVYAQDAPLLRFGLIADVQYCDCETKGTRFYRNSLVKLEAAVADLNQHQVQFTLNLGDLVDRNQGDLDAVLSRQQLINTKVYNVLGNHDYEEVEKNKKLYKKLGLSRDYYSFDENGWRFIVLNTNEIATYANISGKEEKELASIYENIHNRNRNNGQDWNGGISSRQMKWLGKLLQKAQKKSEKVLIFSHHPLYPAEIHAALNDQEILEAISPYADIVKALISGHNHAGAFAVYKEIPCITLEGMVETENETAYAVVDIYEDKMVLKGRARSYEIDLTSKRASN